MRSFTTDRWITVQHDSQQYPRPAVGRRIDILAVVQRLWSTSPNDQSRQDMAAGAHWADHFVGGGGIGNERYVNRHQD
jgi:hypothetical protein